MEEFIIERLSFFGTVKIRKMFGGAGVYLNSKIIGLLYEGEFFIKSKDEAIENYKKQGLAQFSYSKNGAQIYLKYFVLDETVLENPSLFKEYIENCY